MEVKVQPAFISKWTIIPIFYIEVPGLGRWKFVHGMSQQAKRSQRLFLWCSYSLISLPLHTKGRNSNVTQGMSLQIWLPCASTSYLRVFNIRNRSRVMNEHYWPCTLTINLVSCIMQRDLTVQKLPAPHLWHNPVTLEALRRRGAALWRYSLGDNILLLFCWATRLCPTQSIASLL